MTSPKQAPKFLFAWKSVWNHTQLLRVSVSPSHTSLGGGMLVSLQEPHSENDDSCGQKGESEYCKEATTPPALPCWMFFWFNHLHSFCSLTDPSSQRLYCWYHWICFARHRKTREKNSFSSIWACIKFARILICITPLDFTEPTEPDNFRKHSFSVKWFNMAKIGVMQNSCSWFSFHKLSA